MQLNNSAVYAFTHKRTDPNAVCLRRRFSTVTEAQKHQQVNKIMSSMYLGLKHTD